MCIQILLKTSVLICFINSWASGKTNDKVIQCSDKYKKDLKRVTKGDNRYTRVSQK